MTILRVTTRTSVEVNFTPNFPTSAIDPQLRGDGRNAYNYVGPNTFIPPPLRSVGPQFGRSSENLGSSPDVPRSASLSSASSHSSSGASDLEYAASLYLSIDMVAEKKFLDVF